MPNLYMIILILISIDLIIIKQQSTLFLFLVIEVDKLSIFPNPLWGIVYELADDNIFSYLIIFM